MTPKVLFLHSSAGRYGADLQLRALATGLDRSRYNPLAVLPERGELANLLEDGGVETIVAPLAVLRRADMRIGGVLSLPRKTRAAHRALAALVRDRGVALVHSNTSVILSGQPLASELAVPHLVHVREIYPRAPLVWPLMRHRLLQANALACVSHAVMAQFGGAERAFVLHDGLARDPRPTSSPSDPFKVAVLGRISDWKGQDVLARALAEPALADIGTVGLIAGDIWPGAEGPLRRLEELRASLGLGERLQLLGFREDIDSVLGSVHAVAVPSTRPDPLPNSALEAAAAGVPVVAAAHGGLPEIIRDGETGLLVEPGDHVGLARTLRSLADDPERARRMGTAASVDVRARFAPELLSERVSEVYDRLLGA